MVDEERDVSHLVSCVATEGHVGVQGVGAEEVRCTQLVPQNTGLHQEHVGHVRNVPDPTGER